MHLMCFRIFVAKCILYIFFEKIILGTLFRNSYFKIIFKIDNLKVTLMTILKII